MSAATTTERTASITTIRPSKGWAALGLRELWEGRELMLFLCLRDIRIKYKQTVLGVAWAVLSPVFTMVVFTLIFGKVAKIDSGKLPYHLFSFAALVPWTLFSAGLTRGANSLVGNANLVKKVYFPRLYLPTSAVLAGVVDFLIAFLLLLIMMAADGRYPTVNVVFVPLLALLALISSLGFSYWFSALNVQFRDVRHTLPLFTNMLLYATPIAYPSNLIKDPTLKLIYSLNPMAGVVEGTRWALFGADTVPAPSWMVAVSSLGAILLFVTGAYFFKRMERSFADVV